MKQQQHNRKTNKTKQSKQKQHPNHNNQKKKNHKPPEPWFQEIFILKAPKITGWQFPMAAIIV